MLQLLQLLIVVVVLFLLLICFIIVDLKTVIQKSKINMGKIQHKMFGKNNKKKGLNLTLA